MSTYWCRLYDLGGRAVGAERLDAADDAAAIAKAHAVYATGLLSEYELWNDKRLVHRAQINRPQAPQGAAGSIEIG
jgi:hypothetical protein